jgi:hypothetical protein
MPGFGTSSFGGPIEFEPADGSLVRCRRRDNAERAQSANRQLAATAISKISNTTWEITRLVGFKRFANLSMLVKIKTGSPNVR